MKSKKQDTTGHTVYDSVNVEGTAEVSPQRWGTDQRLPGAGRNGRLLSGDRTSFRGDGNFCNETEVVMAQHYEET